MSYKIVYWIVWLNCGKEVCLFLLTHKAMKTIITDNRTLTRLANEGLIEYPITRHGVKPNGKPFTYVDEKAGTSFTDSKGNAYRLEYLSGCFFPYVFRV